MFEGAFSPPEYRDLYHFLDGAQNDIFVDSYDFPLPEPSVNQTVIPKFYAQGGGRRQDTGKAGGESSASASASSPASSSTIASTAQSISDSASKETETVTATKVITVTAQPTAAPSSSATDSADAGEATTIAFSIFASDDIASATTDSAAAASQTAVASNIKAALAGPPASLNDTKLNLAAFVADPVSDSDSSNSIPTSSSPTNSTSFAQKWLVSYHFRFISKYS
jgi:hypothetical protein